MNQEMSLRTPDPLSAFREGLGTRLFPVNYCDLGTRQCNKMSIHYSSYVDESSESEGLIFSS